VLSLKHSWLTSRKSVILHDNLHCKQVSRSALHNKETGQIQVSDYAEVVLCVIVSRQVQITRDKMSNSDSYGSDKSSSDS
jgi:hypothetical protein